ncbi:alpha/beta hydrolase [Mariniphaga sp.]|uniref:alpha/beta hydrolase n=1 Tax=Mariniphaga sp. TaxID=1954475 RepID=UPI0035696C24
MSKNSYNVLVLRVLLSSVLLFVAIAGFAGESEYSVQYGISYYEDSITNSDPYINERCVLDIYYPENQKDFPTVIWFHGGGINSGNKWIPGELKDRGVAVIAVNYRLSPMVKCPAYLEDAAAAVAWTFKNIERFGGNPSKIIVSGHSAGGYLASMIGLDKKWLVDFGIDANEIALLVPFSGHTITHLTIRKERGISDTQPLVDEFAPLFHIRPDAPPMVLILGDRELEMLGRYEENAYFWRMMKVIGHDKTRLYELDGFDHGGMLEPAFLLLQKEIEFFVKQQNQSNATSK